jgi:hypothetical protein
MRTLVLLFLVSFFWGGAQGELDFEKANSLYNEGGYAAAIQAYENILNSGLHSAELYYNLANCYYKQNNVGHSIYYYEKALALKPKDKSILNNLAFAQKMTVDKIEPVPEAGFLNFINASARLLPLDAWAVVCVGLMLVFIGFFTAYYLSSSTRKKRLFFLLGSLSVFAVFIALSLTFQKERLLNTENYAVVFSQAIDVRLEPNLKSESVFRLHEGAKIRILESFQEVWSKIKLADGKTGWIPNDDFKFL